MSATWVGLGVAALVLGGKPLLHGLRGLCDSFLFYAKFKQGIPEASRHFLKARGDPAPVTVFGLGRIVFTARPEFAAEVLHGPGTERLFLHRLGSTWGMRELGMLEHGIIWNNNTERWAHQRRLFTKAVQSHAALQDTANISAQAFTVTMQDVLHVAAGASATEPSLRSWGSAATTTTTTTTSLKLTPPARPLAVRMEGAGGSCEVDLDVLGFLRLVTCRVVCCLAFGIQPSALPYEEAMELVRRVTNYFKAWVFFLHAPRWLVWLREWWAPGQLALHRSYVREFNECAGFVMARGAGAGSQPHGTCGTFLRQALQMQERDELSGAEVQQLVLEMLLAGTDTSSVTMSWLPVAYRDDPGLQQEIQAEVAQLIAGLGPAGSATPPEWPRAVLEPGTQLLGAALAESMRFKPVGPVIIRQATGSALGGMLAAGDTVVLDMASMGQDPRLYPAPQAFNPKQNMLGQANLDKSFMPFGGGPKGCVGHKLADVEMRVIMAHFSHFLHVTGHMDPRTPPLASLETHWDIAAQPTSDVVVRVQLRGPALELAGHMLSAHDQQQGQQQGQQHSMHVSAGSQVAALAPAGPIEDEEEEAAGGLAEAVHEKAGWPEGLTLTRLPRMPGAVRRSPLSILMLSGAHGTGKTTLLEALKKEPQVAVSFGLVSTEVARSMMPHLGIRREDLAHDDKVFLKLQKAILAAQCKLERVAEASVCSDGGLLGDRSGIDPLAYAAWRFGFDSEQYAELRATPEAEKLLARYRKPNCLVLLVPPFDANHTCDDGVRMVSSASEAGRLAACMKEVAQREGVHYVELQQTRKQERVREVLGLLA